MDYQTLKTELDDDPKGLGYTGQTDQEAADKLNEVGASGETIVRESVETADIITALYSNKDEFASLTDSEVAKLNLLSPVGSIAPTDLQAVFLDIFSTGVRPTIRAALIALATRSASRADIVLGAGTTVRLIDVHQARRL
jgi:hypothetical protein